MIVARHSIRSARDRLVSRFGGDPRAWLVVAKVCAGRSAIWVHSRPRRRKAAAPCARLAARLRQ